MFENADETLYILILKEYIFYRFLKPLWGSKKHGFVLHTPNLNLEPQPQREKPQGGNESRTYFQVNPFSSI